MTKAKKTKTKRQFRVDSLTENEKRVLVENDRGYNYLKKIKPGRIIKFIEKDDLRKTDLKASQGIVTKVFKDKFIIKVKKLNRFEHKLITVNDIISNNFIEISND